MEFGLDKYATAVFKHGKLTKSQNISLNDQTMELDKTCYIWAKKVMVLTTARWRTN